MTEETKIETLANLLRERIKRGEYGTSGRIPAVSQLAADHKMARATVYQSLLLLQSEGLLIAKGTSYFVNYPIMRIPGAPLFDKYLTNQGLTPAVDNIVEPEIIPMPAEVAALFGVKEGLHVVHRTRRHGTVEVPYRLAENWYPIDLAGEFIEEMKRDPNLNVAGRIRETHGVAIAKRHDDIIARLPTQEEARLLDLVRTAPVLELRRHFRSQDDRTILFNITILVAAYFVLSYDDTHAKVNGG
jgi:DNA-binding GntR family transcriptional regulator